MQSTLNVSNFRSFNTRTDRLHAPQIRTRAAHRNQPPDSDSTPAELFIRAARSSRDLNAVPPAPAARRRNAKHATTVRVARFPRVVGMRRRQEHPVPEREKNPPTSVAARLTTLLLFWRLWKDARFKLDPVARLVPATERRNGENNTTLAVGESLTERCFWQLVNTATFNCRTLLKPTSKLIATFNRRRDRVGKEKEEMSTIEIKGESERQSGLEQPSFF